MQRRTWKKEERFFQTRKEFSSFRPSTSFIRDTVLPYSIKSYYHKLSSSLPIKKMFLDLEKEKKQRKKQKTLVKYIIFFPKRHFPVWWEL
jgi:hypothetical protein